MRFALVAVLLLPAAALAAGAVELRLEDGVFVASGVAADSGGALTVRVAGSEDVPPLLGTTRASGGEVRFVPRFPPVPGMSYRAEYVGPGGALVVRVFEIPRSKDRPRAWVEAAYPSGDVLPQNLLRIYLHFSAPMSEGEAHERLRLIEASSGREVELPFLRQELWDPGGRRFTVLFDPGRIKRGLVPNREMGAPLQQGESYRLLVDPDWLDAEGEPMAAGFEKLFRVGPPDHSSPDPHSWRVVPPAAGSRDPLRIEFPDSLDRPLALRLIVPLRSTRTPLPGDAAIGEHEMLWRFTPRRPWVAGRYLLAVDAVLEDLAGNSVGRPFEVLPEDASAGLPPETVYLPFEVH